MKDNVHCALHLNEDSSHCPRPLQVATEEGTKVSRHVNAHVCIAFVPSHLESEVFELFTTGLPEHCSEQLSFQQKLSLISIWACRSPVVAALSLSNEITRLEYVALIIVACALLLSKSKDMSAKASNPCPTIVSF